MHLISDPLFYLLAVPAFLITGISKGGFASGGGNMGVPLLSLVVPAPQAAAIALPVLCAMDLVGIGAWRGAWSRRELGILIPGGVVGLVLGSLAYGWLDDRATRVLVGLIALTFLARSLWIEFRPGPPPAVATSSPTRGGFWAALAGFTSTVAHAGGPPLAVYMYPLKLDRRVLTATTVVFFALLNYAKLVPYTLLGQFSTANLLTSLVLLPVAPIGVRIGIWLQGRLPDRVFYRVIWCLLGFTGADLVWEGILG